MDNKGIVITVGGDEIKGLLFSSFFGKTTVEKTESVPVEGGKASDAVKKLLSVFPSDAAITVVVPGRLFMVRKVSLPFNDRKKIRKTLPYEMDGLLPFQTSDLFMDSILSIPSDKGSSVLAISIPKKLLAGYLDIFPDGRRPSRVIPDFAALLSLGINIGSEEGLYGVMEIGKGYASMVFIQAGRPVLMRSVDHAGDSGFLTEDVRKTIKPLLDKKQKVDNLFLTGPEARQVMPALEGTAHVSLLPSTVKKIPLDNRPSFAALVGGALSAADYPWFNILGTGAESERFEKTLKILSIGTAILLISGTADLYLHYRGAAQRLSSLKAETKKVFLSAMPEVKKVVREDAQLKEALNKEKGLMDALAGKPAPSYLDTIRGIEKVVAENPQIKLREASFEGHALTLSGEATGNDADKLKKLFSGINGVKGAQVEEMVQGVEANSYRFRVNIELAESKKDKVAE